MSGKLIHTTPPRAGMSKQVEMSCMPSLGKSMSDVLFKSIMSLSLIEALAPAEGSLDGAMYWSPVGSAMRQAL